ncbi:helix-turn-helix domain-containing protein [Comamonas sp. Z1]|uniref:YdaS family helix-turn-helix protein n=1 Tax=Comamonas sp. Z1 TaxID=2601246 RepID=UPI0011E73E7A|nr:helix-turn-helix domain-containing protein [Comamonas sp. Z1]
MSKKSRKGARDIERLQAAAHRIAVCAIEEVAGKFPSKSQMAREFGVSRQSVNNWMKRGAPVSMCLLIEEKTGVCAERLAPLQDWEQLRLDAKRVAGNQC